MIIRHLDPMTPVETPLLNAEADRRWVPLFTWGKSTHPDGDFVVDEFFFKECKRLLEDFKEDGYFAPVLEGHWSYLTYGRIIDIVENERGIDAHIEFAAGMAQLFDDGYLDSWSPGVYVDFTHPQSGEFYRYGIAEASFVGLRHLKNLPSASPHYARLSEAFPEIKGHPITSAERAYLPKSEQETKPMSDTTQTTTPPTPAPVQTTNPAPVQNHEAPAPAAATTPQSGELEKLRRQLAESNAALEIRTRLPDASPETVSSLAAMTVLNKDQAEHLIKELENKTVQNAGSEQPATPPAVQVQAPIGTPGDPAHQGITTKMALNEAKAAGCKRVSDQYRWAKAKYPGIKLSEYGV